MRRAFHLSRDTCEVSLTGPLLLTFVLALVWACPLLAQDQAQTPCAKPEFRQFDFWMGEWQLTWPASETTAGKAGRGTNRIEVTLDQCVIVEQFDGTPAIRLQGMSVSTFNRRKGKWQQTWVDNFGSYLDFVGEFKDGQMILVREATTPEGKSFLQRMVWKNIKSDSLDWSWERSDDGGQSWKVLWPIHYQRVRVSGASSCPDLAPGDAHATGPANLTYRASSWRSSTADAWRVTGVGGVFFKARDPRTLRAWYAQHLGLEADEDGTVRFWSFEDELEIQVYTVWAPFREDTRYFNPSTKPFMFNFHVVNLDSLLRDLRKHGVNVSDRVETYPYGRFAWLMDPEGNRIELWEPTPGWKPTTR